MCSIGAVVSTGCRHEAAYQSGVSHFLEKLAFQSTGKYKSSDDIVEALIRGYLTRRQIKREFGFEAKKILA